MKRQVTVQPIRYLIPSRRWLLVGAIVATAGISIAFVIRMAQDHPAVLALAGVVITVAFAVEALLQRRTGRVIKPDRTIPS